MYYLYDIQSTYRVVAIDLRTGATGCAFVATYIDS